MNIRPVEGNIFYRSWKLESPMLFVIALVTPYPCRVVFLYPKEHYEEPRTRSEKPHVSLMRARTNGRLFLLRGPLALLYEIPLAEIPFSEFHRNIEGTSGPARQATRLNPRRIATNFWWLFSTASSRLFESTRRSLFLSHFTDTIIL